MGEPGITSNHLSHRRWQKSLNKSVLFMKPTELHFGMFRNARRQLPIQVSAVRLVSLFQDASAFIKWSLSQGV